MSPYAAILLSFLGLTAAYCLLVLPFGALVGRMLRRRDGLADRLPRPVKSTAADPVREQQDEYAAHDYAARLHRELDETPPKPCGCRVPDGSRSMHVCGQHAATMNRLLWTMPPAAAVERIRREVLAEADLQAAYERGDFEFWESEKGVTQ